MYNKFLDKVVDQIMFETELNYGSFNGREQWYVKFPFNDSPWEYDILKFYSFHIVVGNEFSTHCRDIYGLNNDEINYVIKEFGRKLKELKPSTTINENIDKQKQFLNNIVDQIVFETEIDYDNDIIKFPYGEEIEQRHSRELYMGDNYHGFIEHVMDIYGISLREEMEYVLSVYIQTIKQKLIANIDNKLYNNG
jgi:hypothetical protein